MTWGTGRAAPAVGESHGSGLECSRGLELSSDGLGMILVDHSDARFKNTRRTASWRAGSGPRATEGSPSRYSKMSKIRLRRFETASTSVSPEVLMFPSKNVARNPSRLQAQ